MDAWYQDLKGVAKWIWHDQPLQRRYEVGLFHTVLTPPAGTTQIELHVSADNRYTLWAFPQGAGAPRVPLGRGPARSDMQHTVLDSYGLHVTGQALHLYALVEWSPGIPDAPFAEMHGPTPLFYCAVLFFDAAGKLLGKTGTGKAWRARPCAAIRLWPEGKAQGWSAVGLGQEQDGSAFPADWLSPHGADWPAAQEVLDPFFQGDPDFCWGGQNRMVPRAIAHAEQIERVPQSVSVLPGRTPAELTGFTVAAGQSAKLLVDMGEMVLAYPSVRLGGRGARATLTFAEVLRPEYSFTVAKSFSVDSGYGVFGMADRFRAGPVRMTRTHWRSFRFVQVEIVAGEEPAVLEELSFEGTGYPFENQATLEAQGPERDTVAKMVDVSWRTLKCCTWETYMDCPYYEQLQYVGDTRIQCLITYLTTGDAALPAQALRAFDRSRIYEGITQSRYPSIIPQFIPTFSLIYILMIEDYLNHTGDEALPAELRPGIPGILGFFDRSIDPDTGLYAIPADHWSFVDWVYEWEKGIPPAAPNRYGQKISSLLNLHVLLALDAASRIYERAKPGSGNLYFTRANALREKIYDHFYHPPTGLIADVPVDDRGVPALGGRSGGVSFSQHAQALAVLGDVLKSTAASKALSWAMDPAHLAPACKPEGKAAEELGQRPAQFRLWQASFYFRFYLAEALAKARLGREFWNLLAPFRAALENGSTTWPESFEPARSECHAWSSWPLYFLLRHVLGVAPVDAGDGGVEVSPLHCPPLEEVRGRVVTARGPVEVDVEWRGGEAVVAAKGDGVRVVKR